MICATPTLNLSPGMNAVAFYTYIIKFSDFNFVSFMSYTYNNKAPMHGTSVHYSPNQPSPMTAPVTAPQPHSLHLA